MPTGDIVSVAWSQLSVAALDGRIDSPHGRTVKMLTGGLHLHRGGELLARRGMIARQAAALDAHAAIGSDLAARSEKSEKHLGAIDDARLNTVIPSAVELAWGEALYRKLKLQRDSDLAQASTGVRELFGNKEENFAKVAGSLYGFELASESTMRRAFQLAGKGAANFTRRYKAEMTAVAAAKFVVAAPLVIYVIHEEKKHAAAAVAQAQNQAQAAAPSAAISSGSLVAPMFAPPTADTADYLFS